MSDPLARTELLLGKENMAKLRAARVAVFGLGGVGGAVAEALARSGIGALDLIDDDVISETNLNRQILATRETVGRSKAEAAAERVRSIDPQIRVTVHRMFFLPETEGQFDFSEYDYVVDAIDTVTGKLALVMKAKAAGTPVISAMGAGNKLDPTAFRVADISGTSVCPLARTMRKELKKRGVDHLKVVYSAEAPRAPLGAGGDPAEEDRRGTVLPDPADDARPGVSSRRSTPGSVSFVPPVMGFILAGEVIRDLLAI